MMRLFIAIDLPKKIKRELALISFGLPQARWVPHEQLHLTLRFLGEVHITLARTRKTSLARITRFLVDHGLFRLPEFTVSNFHLYSSILTPKGALHRHEAEYLLSRRHILGSG